MFKKIHDVVEGFYREDFKGLTTREALKKYFTENSIDLELEVLSHCTESTGIYVYPDGSMSIDRILSNTWKVLRGTNYPVEILHSFGHDFDCNCDWCADWDVAENYRSELQDLGEGEKERLIAEYNNNLNVETSVIDILECGEKEEYIKACVENNQCYISMEDAIDDVPHGYFDDEVEAE